MAKDTGKIGSGVCSGGSWRPRRDSPGPNGIARTVRHRDGASAGSASRITGSSTSGGRRGDGSTEGSEAWPPAREGKGTSRSGPPEPSHAERSRAAMTTCAAHLPFARFPVTAPPPWDRHLPPLPPRRTEVRNPGSTPPGERHGSRRRIDSSPRRCPCPRRPPWLR